MEQPSEELARAWDTAQKLKGQLDQAKARLEALQKETLAFKLQVGHQLQQLMKLVSGSSL